MRGIRLLQFLLFVLFLGRNPARADTVRYDHRALIINGQRRMLISASIHYPRATPEMWPSLIANAKAGGIDVIETYVFWNGHEPSKGTYNFEGRYDLVSFIKLIKQAGLYANVRIGPYVCAEWNFGGFPVWLRDISGIQFRTNNDAFKTEMQRFVEKIVSMLKAEQLFAPQGGPIILAQIENEYGNIDAPYGAAGKQYMVWAAKMAQSLDTGVPWIMCQQGDAPSYIINTCNGYYCDSFTPSYSGNPKMWTENWSGWFQVWGGATPHRPVEDIAFAVARFFERGGSFQNYYMYFGGTNFDRTSGGPYIITSYDYDAPIDEYGQIRQPKWGHLKDLHSALKQCEPALVSSDGQNITLGPQQEAHVYGTVGSGVCAAFLANIDSSSSATVKFNGQSYVLPAWSVSILSDCKNVIFNTAKVNSQTANVAMTRKTLSNFSTELASSFTWQSFSEPIGVWGNAIQASGLLEQIATTKDVTDYLWYTTSVTISEADAASGKATLVLQSARDVLQIFMNGQYAGAVTTSANKLYSYFEKAVQVNAGVNNLAILCATVGLQNYGAYIETWGAGLNGSVYLKGLPSGNVDLTASKWRYQVGLQGESLRLFTSEGAQSVTWSSAVPVNKPLTWYKTEFDAPDGSNPVALDLETMGKGFAWVNGQGIGRYWPSYHAPQGGCSQSCDYRGAYSSSKCTTGCGQPSQKWYHVPRSWLKSTGNLLVLFEESGGNPTAVSPAARLATALCAHVSEEHPPQLDRWDVDEGAEPHLRLHCSPGQTISAVEFASFGNPTGVCGSFSQGDCHATVSRSLIEQACIGRDKCSVAVTWSKFGYMYIEARFLQCGINQMFRRMFIEAAKVRVAAVKQQIITDFPAYSSGYLKA